MEHSPLLLCPQTLTSKLKKPPLEYIIYPYKSLHSLQWYQWIMRQNWDYEETKEQTNDTYIYNIVQWDIFLKVFLAKCLKEQHWHLVRCSIVAPCTQSWVFNFNCIPIGSFGKPSDLNVGGQLVFPTSIQVHNYNANH